MAKEDNLKSYKPGESGNPNGRPRKIYTILKNKGYSKDDVRTVFQELSFYTPAELKKAIKDPKTPAIMLIAAKAMEAASGKGEYSKVREIIEQAIGKPQGKEDITSGGKEISINLNIRRNDGS